MSYFAQRTLPYQADAGLWPFGGVAPDIVLIALGGNDYVVPFARSPSPQAFQRCYVNFVQEVMAPYDKASTKVLLMCGPFAVTRGTPHFCTSIEAVGKHLNTLGFNASVFDASLPERLSGCFEHPNTKQHERVAQLVIPEIQAMMGW